MDGTRVLALEVQALVTPHWSQSKVGVPTDAQEAFIQVTGPATHVKNHWGLTGHSRTNLTSEQKLGL